MRYPAAEKLEIIRLVEQSRLPVRRTLDKLGVLPARFYRWYDRYQSGGYEALKDRPPRPKQVWNRIPDDVRGRVLRLALDAPELSPRELATRFIDTEGYFVSEASVYWPARCFVPVGMRVYITGDTGDRDTDGCGIARL